MTHRGLNYLGLILYLSIGSHTVHIYHLLKVGRALFLLVFFFRSFLHSTRYVYSTIYMGYFGGPRYQGTAAQPTERSFEVGWLSLKEFVRSLVDILTKNLARRSWLTVPQRISPSKKLAASDSSDPEA